MDRVKTGIKGLDEILKGGIPYNQLTLITGTSGTGKTITCSQFILNGAAKYGENGVYLSFEEPPQSIKENMKSSFGIEFSKLEEEGKVVFIKYDPYRIEDVFDVLESTIRQINAKRVVVDSISALGLHIRDKAELRQVIYNMSTALRKLGTTSLIVSEIVPGTTGLSRYGVEEFVADSVIVYYYERLQSTYNRAVQIWKLRGSSHSETLHPYRITPNGIVVDADQEAFIKGG
ncbi:MAG: ATPase domain-containing protein [Candidatus Aenigmatarchaeota archaeon]|nr:AAA family ATPase [Nanoarchaeota archaeon]